MLSALAVPLIAVALAVLFGLAVGSFLNVVIHRLPKMMERQWQTECAELNAGGSPAGTSPAPVERYNLLVPRSRCPSCAQPISALQNIPVVSYLALGGKCANCKTRISPRYPMVELITGLLAGYAIWRFGATLAGVSALLFVFAMIALTFIDLDTFYLPDDITLPLLWAGLLFNVAGTHTDLTSAVIGAAAGYLALWSVYWLFKLLTGKEGMGYGDFKLLAGIGAWLGWQMLPLVILLSSVVGAVIGIPMMVFARHGRETPIPFGPYLAIAGVIALLHGQAINRQYLNLF
ncbi:MAG: prepilin peptidase [Betaproteobacteria bacterium]|nr:prepilin peptidase [Betaproteobacteria bacterium]